MDGVQRDSVYLARRCPNEALNGRKDSISKLVLTMARTSRYTAICGRESWQIESARLNHQKRHKTNNDRRLRA